MWTRVIEVKITKTKTKTETETETVTAHSFPGMNFTIHKELEQSKRIISETPAEIDLINAYIIIIIFPFVPSKGVGSSPHLSPLYFVIDFVQIHNSNIIPNTANPSLSRASSLPSSWFPALRWPPNKLVLFHSLHVSIPPQSAFSYLLSQFRHLQFLPYVFVSHSLSSCYSSDGS